MYEYYCIIERVVDGDTVDVRVDAGFDIWTKQRVRLLGIDTPESRTRDLREKKFGKLATVRVEELLPVGSKQSIVMVTDQDGASPADYSGVPASVTFDSGEVLKTFTFSATQDDVDDDGESVKLTFGTPLPARVSAGTVSHDPSTCVGDAPSSSEGLTKKCHFLYCTVRAPGLNGSPVRRRAKPE